LQKRQNHLRIAVTCGDPAGIGPEVSLKGINAIKDRSIVPVLIGRTKVISELYPGLYEDYKIIDSKKQNSPEFISGKYIYDVDLDFPVPVPGKGTIETAVESRIYIDIAVDLWKKGLIDAVVTGPVNKGLIEKSGTPFTGHTEYIADLIGETTPFMMMFSSDYRVLLASTHIPLSEVKDYVTPERLSSVIKEGYRSIRSIDGDNVRLVVTGLDPHCGDDGAIGSFDSEITKNVVKQAREDGIPVEGPFAADTIFMPEKWKNFNLVIAHYHDQGLIPFKVLAFDKGVNVTLGLSITRTSVDHGTAFDIAGKNIAGFSSMTEAISVAVSLKKRRNSKKE